MKKTQKYVLYKTFKLVLKNRISDDVSIIKDLSHLKYKHRILNFLLDDTLLAK